VPASPEALLGPLELFGIRLGLESTRRLLSAVGDPHQRFSTVLVAGTNGKGSTAALLAAMATAVGYRTGLYTSPLLEAVEERLRVDGRAVSSRRLAAHLRVVLTAAERVLEHPPTYFEALTVAAFRHFAESGVELAVAETGMGGRLDATNAVEPILSLVTSIALDHQDRLGSSLAQIAREKAGILRPGRRALASLQEPEAAKALAGAAAEVGASLMEVSELATASHVASHGWLGQSVAVTTARASYRFELPLLGRHQIQNLALAVAAAEGLFDLDWKRFEGRVLEEGVGLCRWPGRLESVELADGARVLLDGAHNAASSVEVAAFLDQLGEPYALLFGALGDKDVSAMLESLASGAHRVYLTAPPHERARPPAGLLAELPSGLPVETIPQSERALERALETTQGLVVVSGSLYLVGHLRRWLRQRYGVPEPAVASLMQGDRRSERRRTAPGPESGPLGAGPGSRDRSEPGR
jgi:dihydrofolate synthase/folylpolyglutamate synthase